MIDETLQFHDYQFLYRMVRDSLTYGHVKKSKIELAGAMAATLQALMNKYPCTRHRHYASGKVTEIETGRDVTWVYEDNATPMEKIGSVSLKEQKDKFDAAIDHVIAEHIDAGYETRVVYEVLLQFTALYRDIVRQKYGDQVLKEISKDLADMISYINHLVSKNHDSE